MAAVSRVVLIPVDESEYSGKCIDYEMKIDGDEVHLTHFYEAPSLPVVSFKSPMNIPWEEWKEKMLAHGKKIEDLLYKYQLKFYGKHVKCLTYSSDDKPGEGICEYAKKHDVDIIVMGTRGMNAALRTIIGSVSDYVLHNSHKPVTIVPL